MLPSDIEKRKEYNSLINRGVQLLREQDQIKDDLSQLKAEVEENIGKDFAKQFPTLVKVRYKNSEIKEKADKQLEMIEELKILEKLENGVSF